MATTSLATDDVIGDREAARLSKHFLGLEEKRLELGRSVSLIEKEQTAIKAKLEKYVLATSPRERVVRLAKAVISVVTVASARYIGWKGEFIERVGQAAAAELEANPPKRDVVKVAYNLGAATPEDKSRKAA